jgi:hypothetical protein
MTTTGRSQGKIQASKPNQLDSWYRSSDSLPVHNVKTSFSSPSPPLPHKSMKSPPACILVLIPLLPTISVAIPLVESSSPKSLGLEPRFKGIVCQGIMIEDGKTVCSAIGSIECCPSKSHPPGYLSCDGTGVNSFPVYHIHQCESAGDCMNCWG